MKFKPDGHDRMSVSVHDGPASGVTVPPFALPTGWAGKHRDLLARVHEIYPREVVETSPGAYKWRRHSDA